MLFIQKGESMLPIDLKALWVNFSRVINTKKLRDVRSQPHHCCYVLRLGLRPRFISILQDWHHGQSRLRSRLMGSLAGISHNCTFCHYHTATRESRTTTLSITIQALWINSRGGCGAVTASSERCSRGVFLGGCRISL